MEREEEATRLIDMYNQLCVCSSLRSVCVTPANGQQWLTRRMGDAPAWLWLGPGLSAI